MATTPTNLAQYYTGKGQPLPSVADRAGIFATAGLGASTEYKGTISQNNSLLAHLTSQDEAAAKAKAGTTVPDTAVQTSNPPPPPTNPPAPGNPAAANAPTTAAGFRSEVTPAGGEPSLPKYTDTYSALRASQGIDTLEDNINNLSDQKAALEDQLPAFKATNEIGATSGGVFNARMSEEQRNISEQVAILDRQITLAQNNLSIKNDYINSMMSFTEKDYTAAKDQYETDFTHNITIQNAVDTQADKVQTAARANLTTMNNIIANSGMSLDNFLKTNPTFRNSLASVEAQAGMPPGFLEAFAKAKPKANVIGMGTAEADVKGNMFIPIIYSDEFGKPYTVYMYTGGYKTSTSLDWNSLFNGGSSATTPATDNADTTTPAYENLPPPVQ